MPDSYDKSYYTERKNRLRAAVMDGRDFCATCGENDPRCLDLHHIDPETKKFTLSAASYGRSLESWLEEAAKCIVLCSNYHRKLHGNL